MKKSTPTTSTTDSNTTPVGAHTLESLMRLNRLYWFFAVCSSAFAFTLLFFWPQP
jgi:hypothetical protein